MSPSNDKPTPWWQTLLISIANVALAAVVNRYLGPAAAAGSVAAGTGIAHAMTSPRDK